MENPNSQKKSPRSSAKSERTTSMNRERPRLPVSDVDYEQYLDRSFDLVARVRAAKEAAQRKMEEFGDPSEYEVSIIQGLKKDVAEGTPASLDFQPGPHEDE